MSGRPSKYAAKMAKEVAPGSSALGGGRLFVSYELRVSKVD
jgi:hypothetical protein